MCCITSWGSFVGNHGLHVFRVKTCGEAIEKGLELYEAKSYDKAIEVFNRSLELPGTGTVRKSGRAKEFRYTD